MRRIVTAFAAIALMTTVGCGHELNEDLDGKEKVASAEKAIWGLDTCTDGSANQTAYFTPYPAGHDQLYSSITAGYGKNGCYNRYTVEFRNVLGQSFQLRPRYREIKGPAWIMNAADCVAVRAQIIAWGYKTSPFGFSGWQQIGSANVRGDIDYLERPFLPPLRVCVYRATSVGAPEMVSVTNSAYTKVRVAISAWDYGSSFGSQPVSVRFEDL